MSIRRIHLDDVPGPQKERRVLGIVARTDQSNARRPYVAADVGVGAYLEFRRRAGSRQSGVEPARCVDAEGEHAVQIGNELLDRLLELLTHHSSFKKSL